jgi:hypothetical protein
MISEPGIAEGRSVSDIMSDILIASRAAGLKRALASARGSAARVAGDSLCLAATPTFAIMALLTACGGGQPDMLCAVMRHTSWFGGMAAMYSLMSVFHARPWLRLLSC